MTDIQTKPCTECEPATRKSKWGRGRIAVPCGPSPYADYEFIECPTCHGAGRLVVCNGCGALWALDARGNGIDYDGANCDECPEAVLLAAMRGNPNGA